MAWLIRPPQVLLHLTFLFPYSLPAFLQLGSFENTPQECKTFLVYLKPADCLSMVSIYLCVSITYLFFSHWKVQHSVCPEPPETLKSFLLMK